MKVIKSFPRIRGYISDETLDNSLMNKPKSGKFYLLPKIHKRFHNVPGRSVMSVRSYHVTYAFQSESTLYSCLNVKELLPRNRREI